MIFQHRISSPIGSLSLTEENGFLTGLYLQETADIQGSFAPSFPSDDPAPQTPLLIQTQKQLEQYFAGKRQIFDLPIRFQGTPFRHRVWEALCTIPYGQTRSYQDIADLIGSPKAVRAVGQANHNNPLMILVPCHRVIHKNGDLSGYACGGQVKRFLLELEGVL